MKLHEIGSLGLLLLLALGALGDFAPAETPPEPPPRCLKFTPNPARVPLDCVNAPDDTKVESDPEKMRYQFQKTKWNRNHY